MNKSILLFISFIIILSGCSQSGASNQLELEDSTTPKAFMSELTPSGMLIHAGSFSPDLKQYYYTLSDTTYSQFDTFMIEQTDDTWSDPQPAVFNSTFSDHGVKFSPDGQQIYFASTRPIDIEGVANTWHLWKVNKTQNGWSEPKFIDIPNLRDKLVSHPSITTDGTLYYHVSNLDYSEMRLYFSLPENGRFGKAEKVSITANSLACTPFVTADEQTLLYAKIGETLDLMISHKANDGKWTTPIPLNSTINTHGQGNPYLTPDGKHLFYTSSPEPTKWQINKASTENWLK